MRDSRISDRLRRRPLRLWPLLIALITGLIALSTQAEEVVISPEGVRASAVDIDYDAEGTAAFPAIALNEREGIIG
tara:strand:+ start:287 stop:514 length:228 start_codon:yes stop_codon:yes gene_type:complete